MNRKLNLALGLLLSGFVAAGCVANSPEDAESEVVGTAESASHEIEHACFMTGNGNAQGSNTAFAFVLGLRAIDANTTEISGQLHVNARKVPDWMGIQVPLHDVVWLDVLGGRQNPSGTHSVSGTADFGFQTLTDAVESGEVPVTVYFDNEDTSTGTIKGDNFGDCE